MRNRFVCTILALLVMANCAHSLRKVWLNQDANDKTPSNWTDLPSLLDDEESAAADKGISLDDAELTLIEDSEPLAEPPTVVPRQAVQSPFVDQVNPPLANTGPDPRYQTPADCQPDQYKCEKVDVYQVHVRCIPHEWKCNGMRDCELNDDETGCDRSANDPSAIRHAVQATCHSSQHTCYGTGINGIAPVCMDRQRVCDGVNDCSYGDDEFNCPPKPSNVQHESRNSASYHASRVNEAASYSQSRSQSQPSSTQQQECAQPSRSEEYIKQLEWRDRCYRTCMKIH